MPVLKDLKRRVRARMQKTGETYTTARMHVLGAERGVKPTPPVADYAALAGMRDAAVAAKTGRTWNQWVTVLDAAGAAALPHAAIARYLHEVHGVPGWWAQTVTVGYERIRGLRAKGQRRGGGYDVNKSKTLSVPIGKLYRAFAMAKQRASWLGDHAVRVKTTARDKSVRWLWTDGTPVDVHFWPKGPQKSQVVIQQRELASPAAADQQRAFWTARLMALVEVLSAR
jgi:hypothetical protein